MKCGRVFFDVSADIWTEGCEPSGLGVAGEAALLTGGIIGSVIVSSLVPFVGLAVLGGSVATESLLMKDTQIKNKAAKISEVHADGRIAVVSGAKEGDTHEMKIELFNAQGHLTSLSQNDGTHQGAINYMASFTPANGGETTIVAANAVGV